jgi:branched-chain amino acid transport system substrate-binding protein
MLRYDFYGEWAFLAIAKKITTSRNSSRGGRVMCKASGLKTIIRRVVLVGSIACGVDVLAISHSHAAAVCQDPIKIGITTPLTGGIALQGAQVKNAIETAVDEINASGGISGKKIKLIVEDTTGTVTVAINALNRVLREEPILVFGSMISPENFAQSDIIKKEQVPFLYAGTNAQLSAQNIPWIFRISYHDGQLAKVLPSYIEKRKLKPALLAVADDFGLGAVKNIRGEFDKIKIVPAAMETYAPTDRDMTAQLLKIKDSGADSIVIVGRTPDLIVILKGKARLGLKFPIMGNTSVGAATTLTSLSDADADGSIVFGGALPNGSQDKKLIDWTKKLTEKYNFPPDNWALAYYDAAYLVRKIIADVGCDKEAIRNALAKVQDFQGLITKYSSKDGNLTNVIYIYKLQGKTPILEEVVSP